MNKINTIDLFCGCGGLLEGFLQSAHYNALGSVDWELAPCENLRVHLKRKWGHQDADNEVIRFDIQRTPELLNGFSDKEYGEHKGLDSLVNGKKVELIIGGPPCQAYSIAGRIRDEQGMKNDYRNYLFESYLRIVSHYKPSYFIFENVPGMLSAAPDGEPIVKKIRASFLEAGYDVLSDFSHALFDLTNFGIPQKRKRVIILGVNKERFEKNTPYILHDFYKSVMPSFYTSKRTVRDAIGDLPHLYPCSSQDLFSSVKLSHSSTPECDAINHSPRFHSTRDIEIFQLLAEDIASGECKYTDTEELIKLYHERTGGKSTVHKYYVLRWNEPSNTIPAHLYKDGLRHIHPDPRQARSITVREAARLQTFPDDYIFIGSKMLQYKMIGNAVPPQFAKILADTLFQIIHKYGI